MSTSRPVTRGLDAGRHEAPALAQLAGPCLPLPAGDGEGHPSRLEERDGNARHSAHHARVYFTILARDGTLHSFVLSLAASLFLVVACLHLPSLFDKEGSEDAGADSSVAETPSIHSCDMLAAEGHGLELLVMDAWDTLQGLVGFGTYWSTNLLADALDNKPSPWDSDEPCLVRPGLVCLLLAECDASVWHRCCSKPERTLLI